MDWAEDHIKRLKAGETVTFRPRGGSMEPLVLDNQEVTVKPLTKDDVLVPGDIVLCKVERHSYLHLIKRCEHKLCLIGNNKGRINGWVKRDDVFGRMVRT